MDSFRKAKGSLLGEEEEDENPFKDLCKLSYKARLIGFATCCGIGLVLWIISLLSIGAIVTQPARFAVMYTVGNIVSLCGTGFLIGPMRQIKRERASCLSVCRLAALSILFAVVDETVWFLATNDTHRLLFFVCLVVVFVFHSPIHLH